MAKEFLYFTSERAPERGPYDEAPMLPGDLDLQLHLSRNDRPQPFHLICEHDTVLVVMSGRGFVEFKDAPVLRHTYEVGDFLYVPAGTPHRIVPAEPSVHHRFKLPETTLEGVAWYCRDCGSELSRDVWDLGEESCQQGYRRACETFNEDEEGRTCADCGAVHPEIDLAPYRWDSENTVLAAPATASAGD